MRAGALASLLFCAVLTSYADETEEPISPPPGSTCTDARARDYADEKQFAGLRAMTELAQRRYPGSRVQMGLDALIKAQLFGGECMASVPFYFSHPDRLELWSVVLVDAEHKARFISAWAADFVAFDVWRTSVGPQ